MATTHIFTPTSDYATITIKDREILDAVGPVGEAYGTTKIDLGLGYPALLVIYNADHKVYRRSGSSYFSATSGTNSGSEQHELILVDAEGNIDASTPFMFDYSKLTRIDVIRTDIDPITIKGGVVTTIACGLDANYVENGVVKEFGYYNRGINVNRSYTTVDGVKHFVVGEISMDQQALGIEGAYYHGFLYGSSATDVTFKDCQVQGRRYYGLNGTYDLGGNLVNNLTFIGCDQINFWIDAEGNVSDFEKGELSMRVNYFDTDTAYKKSVRHCWGVGGTNFCKNMNYIDSRLSRFDAHCGLYNGSIINSELTFFAITGKGTFEVRDTTWYSAGEGQTDNSLIYMRGDYGSTWEGDVILDNVKAYVSNGAFYMLFHSYNNWEYGYKCHIPNMTINNLSLYSVKSKQPLDDNIEITFVSGGKDDYMHLDATKSTSPKAIIYNPDTGVYELIKDTTGQYTFNHISGVYEFDNNAPMTPYRNHNPIGMPDYIKITNNTHNYKFVFVKSEDPNFYWANTKFYYSDTDYYLGTNHNRTETFLFT